MGFRRIYLIGFMGCGKSHTGRQLAENLHWGFIDLDDLIEKRYASTIEDIFKRSGEIAFRNYEAETLRNLELFDNTIVSVGGGAPCFSDNIDFMNSSGKTIYLRMSPALLSERLRTDKKPRPLLKNLNPGQLEDFIRIKLTEREIYYLKASEVVEADDLKINDLINSVLRLSEEMGK